MRAAKIKVIGETVSLGPWIDPNLAECVLVEDSDFKQDGESEILLPKRSDYE